MYSVLFRDQADNSLFTMAIDAVLYDPETEGMLFYSTSGNEIVISDITQEESNALVKNLYLEKNLDMTTHPAYLNPEEIE